MPPKPLAALVLAAMALGQGACVGIIQHGGELDHYLSNNQTARALELIESRRGQSRNKSIYLLDKAMLLRMQQQLEKALPYALGIFEPSPFEEELVSANIFAGEEALKSRWIETISSILRETDLSLPALNTVSPQFGGRLGQHTEHLQPLLTEMGEVIQIDPSADW